MVSHKKSPNKTPSVKAISRRKPLKILQTKQDTMLIQVPLRVSPRKKKLQPLSKNSPLPKKQSKSKLTLQQPSTKASAANGCTKTLQKPVLSPKNMNSPLKATPQKDDDSPMPSPCFKQKKKLSFASPAKRTPRKSLVYYHNALDQILNEMQARKAKDDKIKELEQNICQLMLVNEVTRPIETLAHENSDQDTGSCSLQLPKDRIQALPPGLKILEPARCFRYFSSVEDIVAMDDGLDSTPLARFPVDFWPELIERGAFLMHSLGNNPTPGILLFLLRLMAIHESKSVVAMCKKTFEHYVSTCKQDFSWCPSLADVVAIILNYGSGKRDHCPVRQMFVDKVRDMSVMGSPSKRAKRYKQIEPALHVCKCQRKHIKVVDYHNLTAIVQVLGLCISQWNTYCSEHLSQLVLLLCWLSLDHLLLSQNVASAIETSIDSALTAIVEEDWPPQMAYLSMELAMLGEHHHNTVHIVRLLLPTTRGIQLQKSTAFTAMQSLMDEEPSVLALVTPKDVLRFLKGKKFHEIGDYYLLYNIVSLLEIVVGDNVSTYKSVIQALSNLLMKTFSRINDSLLCMEGTQLKNLIIIIRTKWYFIMQDVSSEEKPTVKTKRVVKKKTSPKKVDKSPIEYLVIH